MGDPDGWDQMIVVQAKDPGERTMIFEGELLEAT